MKYSLHFTDSVAIMLLEDLKGVFCVSIAKENMEVKINKAWCKGCGICVAFCPKKVLGYDSNGKVEMLDAVNCIKCGQCELRCPDFAIFLGGIDNE